MPSTGTEHGTSMSRVRATIAVLFIAWWLSNSLFAVDIHRLFRATTQHPTPADVAIAQTFLGLVLSLVLYHVLPTARGVTPTLRLPPPQTPRDTFALLLAVGTLHFVGSWFTAASYAAIGASSTLMWKLTEPLPALLFNRMLLSQTSTPGTVLSVLVIMAGVLTFTGGDFRPKDYSPIIASNLIFPLRNVLVKKLNRAPTFRGEQGNVAYPDLLTFGLPVGVLFVASRFQTVPPPIEVLPHLARVATLFNVYQFSSVMLLSLIDPVSHSVLNTFKRFTAIVFAMLTIAAPTAYNHYVGIFIAYAGFIMYAFPSRMAALFSGAKARRRIQMFVVGGCTLFILALYMGISANTLKSMVPDKLGDTWRVPSDQSTLESEVSRPQKPVFQEPVAVVPPPAAPEPAKPKPAAPEMAEPKSAAPEPTEQKHEDSKPAERQPEAEPSVGRPVEEEKPKAGKAGPLDDNEEGRSEDGARDDSAMVTLSEVSAQKASDAAVTKNATAAAAVTAADGPAAEPAAGGERAPVVHLLHNWNSVFNFTVRGYNDSNRIYNNVGDMLWREAVQNKIPLFPENSTRLCKPEDLEDDCVKRYEHEVPEGTRFVIHFPFANILRPVHPYRMFKLLNYSREPIVDRVLVNGIGVNLLYEDTATDYSLTHPNWTQIASHYHVNKWLPHTLTSLNQEKVDILTRGDLTNHVVTTLGFTRAISTGCPSVFLNEDVNLGTTLRREYEKIYARIGDRSLKLAVAVSDFENSRTLFRHIYETYPDTIFIAQRNKCMHLLFSLKIPYDRVRVFTNLPEWQELMKTRDAYFGARIHGSMVAVSMSKPVLLIGRDYRLLELVQKMKVPHLTSFDERLHVKNLDVARLFQQVGFDWRGFDHNRCKAAQIYKNLYAKVGLGVKPHVEKLSQAC